MLLNIVAEEVFWFLFFRIFIKRLMRKEIMNKRKQKSKQITGGQFETDFVFLCLFL